MDAKISMALMKRQPRFSEESPSKRLFIFPHVFAWGYFGLIAVKVVWSF
ncbi:MAG: hypothetical protein IKV79_05635 [Oscillospiraceae bacterium]|nr:hypothetical protein [Oscillospiraceae bacterium]